MNARNERPGGEEPPGPLLSVESLSVAFSSRRGAFTVVDNVSYSINPGEVVALVGESGCGKSVSSLAVMRLLPRPHARVTSGRVMFDGHDLLALPEAAVRNLRGREVAMIFQEPMTSLNPVLTIGLQLAEPLAFHSGMRADAARRRSLELLEQVGISDPERRLSQYPHQLSGGMRQRVMIAMGLACSPRLIIADEPTTALDVTIQAQILELMKDLSRRLNIALLLITHNLGIVARYADRVNVMYAGRIVEQGSAADIFGRPRHPYTIGLLRSVPRLDQARRGRLAGIAGLPPDPAALVPGCRFAPRCPIRIAACDAAPPFEPLGQGRASRCHRAVEIEAGTIALAHADVEGSADAVSSAGEPLLAVRNLSTSFPAAAGWLRRSHPPVRAVDDVSFEIPRGQTLGLVGESGCGKTTTARTVLRLTEATSGEVTFEGVDVRRASGRELRRVRTRLQVIFQDPMGSIDPRMTVGEVLAEPIRVHRLAGTPTAVRSRVYELLAEVGLDPALDRRYAHQLSGGQRQRVGIARALSFDPSLIVCDEPVSALDVSVQAQIINLLDDLQRRRGLSYLLVAHDLAVVRQIAHRVAVMYLGRVVEQADREDLYERPLHPYTRALLAAAPIPDPALERARPPAVLRGEIPSPLNPPSGCAFHTRCPLASQECRTNVPSLRELRPRQFVACLKA